MKRPGRKLAPEEAALWARVARTVMPLEGRKLPLPPGEVAARSAGGGGGPRSAISRGHTRPGAPSTAFGGPPPPAGEDRRTAPLDRRSLDASWDRKLARGLVQPDFTLDLHGASLEAAHARLDHGLTQALAQGARVVLLITGRQRVSDDHASRGGRRGAIRAKFLDWLAAGPHASRIAAVRPAHPRHGGPGSVYLVLRRNR